MQKCSILGSTYYTSNDELKKIGDNMRELGFSDYNVFNSKNNNFGKWAGTPEERLKLFYDSWESNDDAIFSIRGGSGASHFVSKIDVARLSKRKMFVGYSDLTLILNYLNSKLGLITLHGPMAVADLDYTSLYFLKKALAMQDYSVDFSERAVINRSRSDVVRGKMIGGNLTRLIESLLHFDLDFKDKIVFLEETGESQAKVLNMLFTLSAYSSFKPSAIVLGYMGVDVSRDLEEMIAGIFPDVPIVYNLPFGHSLPNISIPIGAMGVIDFSKGKIAIEFPDDHKDYAIGLNLGDAQEPESFRDYFFEDNRKNRLFPIPKRQSSIESILKIYRSKNQVKSTKLSIRIGHDIVSVSREIAIGKEHYVFVEYEDGGKIQSSFFVKDKGAFIPAGDNVFGLRSPRISVLDNRIYLTGVEGDKHVVYSGESILDLKIHKRFSEKVEEMTFIAVKERLEVFVKYDGNLHHLDVGSIDEINESKIKKSDIVLRLFRGNSLGIVQSFLLDNGLIGVFGYVERKTKHGENRFSYPMVFCFDHVSKRVSSMRIILRRAELPERGSRRPDEYNMVMPGGFLRGNNNCWLYLTVGNRSPYKVKIKDPFSYYEKKF